VTAEARFAELVGTMLARSDATYGADSAQGARRSFGSTSLKANGKIFAMLVKERLVVKLSASRVDELVAAGAGERFDPGHGRIQREWLSVASSAADDWLALAIESEEFVSRRGAGRRPDPADRRPAP
jgi:TfoX/Sxy family transcriptional regulator of competence genes